MKQIKKQFTPLLLAVIMALSLTVPAFAVDSGGRKTSADTAAAYAAQYGGAQSLQYAVWEDGTITLTGHVGAYSRTESRALSDDTLYGIGSISKMYTTAAVMQLVQSGKIQLDAPVTRYLPNFKMADERYKQITVRMLLNHSSGLMGSSTDSAFLFDDPDRSATEDLLNRLATQRLKADPGAYSVYCNDGFTLAELVVEAVSGKSFPDYLREDLLTPAGLTNTYAPGDGFDTARLAKTYSGSDSRALPRDCLGIVGTGGMDATASDLASFGGALTSAGLLSQSSLNAMSSAEYAKGIWPADDLDLMSYGLGWDSVKTYPFCQSDIQALVKGGDTLYYHAGLVVIPEYHLAAAVVSSGGVSLYDEMAASRMLIDALAQRGVTVNETVPKLPAADPVAMPADLLSDAGYYGSSAQLMKIDVTNGGTLSIHSLTYPSAPVQTFTYASDGFFRDSTGASLVKLVKESNGQIYLYQKAVTPVPGLGAVPTSNYAAEKLPDHPVSKDVQAAWAAANAVGYLPMNEKYTSQLYLQMSVQSASSADAAGAQSVPGYIGVAQMVDATHARYFPQIPELAGRDGSDMTLMEKNGVTWLTASTSIYMAKDGAKDIFAGSGCSYSTIQSDGYARWYQVGDASGKTMTVTVPEHGGFYVYDAAGQVVASSVLWGDTEVKLPSGGLVVFAGDSGARFHLHFTAAK